MRGLRLELRDVSLPLVAAWRQEFRGVKRVKVSSGDIFGARADAILSPANSFGFMVGGIDGVYTRHFGWRLQRRLQRVLAQRFGGELPIGMAVIVPTRDAKIPWLVSAPTMRLPADVSRTANAYLAFKAALAAIEQHNRRSTHKIRSLLSPGMATAVGAMSALQAARQMRTAWDRANDPFLPLSMGEAAMDEAELLLETDSPEVS